MRNLCPIPHYILLFSLTLYFIFIDSLCYVLLVQKTVEVLIEDYQ